MLSKLTKPFHPSWAFYSLVCGILAGLIFGITAETNFLFPAWPIVFLIIVIILCLRKSCLFTAAIIFCVGILLGNFRVSFQLIGRDVIKAYQGQTALISGTLTDDPDTSKGMAIRLQHLRLYSSITTPDALDSADFTEISGTMYVSMSGQPELERSDTILLKGKLGEGFGTFVASMYRPELLAIERLTPGDIPAQIKHWFADVLRQFIPSPEVDLGLGYLMGIKSGLSTDFSEALRAVGMTHVIVASGTHLSILIGAAKKLFGKISKFAGLFGSLLLILCFVLIVGFTPSMTRAALVASLSLLVGYVGRKFTPMRLISFVVMLTLLIKPINFLDLGWQLSFASFFGILILGPHLQKSFYGGKQPPWLASMLLTSLSTCLICAPVLVYNFGSLSLLSFVANLIILPTLPYIMFLMLLTSVTSFLFPLAQLLGAATTWLLRLHIFVVNFLSEKTMLILELPSSNPKIYLLYLPILLYLTFPTLHKLFRKTFHPKTNSPQPAPEPIELDNNDEENSTHTSP